MQITQFDFCHSNQLITDSSGFFFCRSTLTNYWKHSPKASVENSSAQSAFFFISVGYQFLCVSSIYWWLITAFPLMAHVYWWLITGFPLDAHIYWWLITGFPLVTHIYWWLITGFHLVFHIYWWLITGFLLVISTLYLNISLYISFILNNL